MSKMTSYTLQLMVLVLILHTISCEMSFNCLRKGQDCKGGGVCLSNGTCDCTAVNREGFNCDIDPAMKSDDPAACSCKNKGVCMTGGACSCTETHYGSKCEYKRDEILCFGNRKIIFVYPVGLTAGEVFISGQRECKFSQVKDVENKTDFNPEWNDLGKDGYVLTINDVDEPCGNITETTSEDGTTVTSSRFVNVEFDSRLITSLDVILEAKCEKTTNDTRPFDGVIVKTNITADNYQQQETVNKYEPLKFATKYEGTDLGDTVVMVGSEIKLEFTIPEDTGYETLIITSLRAEAPNDGNVAIDLVENKCATVDSSSILVSIEKSEDNRTVTATLKAFVFVNQDNLKITGSARICKPGDGGCAERTDCTSNTVKGLGRRKRDSGDSLEIEQNIRVTTDPKKVTTPHAQTGNEQECPEPEVDEDVHCLQQMEIIIVLALLAATVVVLLIACIILTWRLLRRGTKVAEVHPFEFENQSNRSLPRLSPSNF